MFTECQLSGSQGNFGTEYLKRALKGDIMSAVSLSNIEQLSN